MELDVILLPKVVNDKEYEKFFTHVMKLATSLNVPNEDFPKILFSKITESSLDYELKNIILRHLSECTTTSGVRSPISGGIKRSKAQMALFKVQMNWDKRLLKSLVNLAKEQGRILIRARSERNIQEMNLKWNELSSWDTDLSSYKPLYGPKDLFDLLLSLKDQQQITRLERKWSVVVSGIDVTDLQKISDLYKNYLEEGLKTEWDGNSQFSDNGELRNRIILGNAVARKNHPPLAEEYCKSRCPPELRKVLWTQILDSSVTNENLELFEHLRDMALRQDLLVDKLILKVMLCLTRDSDLNRLVRSDDLRKVVSSPSALMPCYGISMYAAPLCYVYDVPSEIYFALKNLYIKYWHHLHYLDDNPSGLVHLATLFERLLQTHEPDLWTHFLSHEINALQIALPWIVRAFSGFLSISQLLSLWDIILGHDSLQILPLLAAAVFSLRRHALFNISSQHCAEVALADLSSIRVFPLLYLTLQREDNARSFPGE
ncbi:TBC1 domain family member 19-like isoform X2 [Artemia franciscana]|uniref:Rab-GAP TBC domain-containing protein n=1 Tax=Artemia franciscana TaxID=6661 RepID=A0AA88I4K3_ARTSF|nr:hypothetical protein QYM36_006781 [Artemia franciscana]